MERVMILLIKLNPVDKDRKKIPQQNII